MTSSNGGIFRVTDHLCWKFTGRRWIPLTNTSDPDLWCFLWSTHEQTVESTMETPSRSLWRHCNAYRHFGNQRRTNIRQLHWYFKMSLFKDAFEYHYWSHNILISYHSISFRLWHVMSCVNVCMFYINIDLCTLSMYVCIQYFMFSVKEHYGLALWYVARTQCTWTKFFVCLGTGHLRTYSVTKNTSCWIS